MVQIRWSVVSGSAGVWRLVKSQSGWDGGKMTASVMVATPMYSIDVDFFGFHGGSSNKHHKPRGGKKINSSYF